MTAFTSMITRRNYPSRNSPHKNAAKSPPGEFSGGLFLLFRLDGLRWKQKYRTSLDVIRFVDSIDLDQLA